MEGATCDSEQRNNEDSGERAKEKEEEVEWMEEEEDRKWAKNVG